MGLILNNLSYPLLDCLKGNELELYQERCTHCLQPFVLFNRYVSNNLCASILLINSCFSFHREGTSHLTKNSYLVF